MCRPPSGKLPNGAKFQHHKSCYGTRSVPTTFYPQIGVGLKHSAAEFCPGANLRFLAFAESLRLCGEPAALPRPKYFLKFQTNSHHILPSIPIF
jgi:hypothetical protein